MDARDLCGSGMSTAVHVEGLGKAYPAGRTRSRFLGQALRQALVAPFRERPGGDPFWALKDVSFDVSPGEVVGIVGRNGAGKSTLLKILSRITEPTEGFADIRGRVGSLLEVGTGFHPDLSGRENVFLNGAILGMRRREIHAKLDEIVAFAEIEQVLDTPVKHYSSGLYMRLAFSVAAHLEPEILIVDEVLAVGDSAFQRKCLDKMGSVARSGRTVLFVSHNLAAVEALCTRACLLVEGRLAVEDTPARVIDRYIESVAGKAETPLCDRRDREGDGRLRFTSLTLRDRGGETVDALISGRDAAFRLGYSGDGSARHVSVALSFYTQHGTFLLQCDNEMSGHPFETLPPRGILECRIPRLPFTAGTYRVNLFCRVNGVLADWVQDAALVTVVEGDFYGTGKSAPPGHGGFLATQEWRAWEAEE
jgi:lipopolysaccharide transport system ATP-binding protein